MISEYDDGFDSASSFEKAWADKEEDFWFTCARCCQRCHVDEQHAVEDYTDETFTKKTVVYLCDQCFDS